MEDNHEAAESPLQRRLRHEAKAVQQLGQTYARLIRVQSLLASLRDTATGLVLSPYVGAASSVQGYDVGVVQDTSEEQEDGRAMETD